MGAKVRAMFFVKRKQLVVRVKPGIYVRTTRCYGTREKAMGCLAWI